LQIKDSEEFIRVATLFNISRDDISELPFDSLKELKGVLDNSSNYISNSIYDYLENFELYLNNSDKKRTKSIFKILKDEELSLFKASGISFYLSEDVRDQDIVQALGVIKLFKGLVKSAKTTEVSINDPYGFLIARQNFARRNKIEDDVLNLKPITSDIAELAEKDLESLEEKLIFLRTLAKSNSSKTVVEDNILEEKATNLLLPEFTKINNFKLKYKDREIIPDLTSILSSTSSPAKKIVEIKDAIFLHNKELSNEGKLNAFKYLLSEKFDFINQLEKIDKLNKDTNTLSQHFIVSQLASAFSISSKDFINKQRNLLKTEFNAVPFYSQMLASEITYASIVNPEIFKLISNMFAIEETHITDYISYVLGGAGTGKSSVIFRSVLNMLKDSNPTLNV
jgi:hypothetical protein